MLKYSERIIKLLYFKIIFLNKLIVSNYCSRDGRENSKLDLGRYNIILRSDGEADVKSIG